MAPRLDWNLGKLLPPAARFQALMIPGPIAEQFSNPPTCSTHRAAKPVQWPISLLGLANVATMWPGILWHLGLVDASIA